MTLALRRTSLALFVLSSAAASAQTVHIHFDNLPDNTVITNQYPEATFSSETGFVNVTTAQNLGTSLPNFLCTAVAGGGLTCVNDTYVDFTMPVSNLTLLTTGDNNAGVTANIDVYVNFALAATVDVVTDGDPYLPDLVDLSAFADVTRIEIRQIVNLAGLGWDDFIFDIGIGTKYCAATANSTGSAADLTTSGSASSGAGDLALTSSPVPNQNGIFFHGMNQSQTPFGNGFLCATGDIFRGAVVMAAGNTVTYTYDNSDAKHSLAAYVGMTRNFQHWFRDPMGGGALFNLSNAVSISILP